MEGREGAWGGVLWVTCRVLVVEQWKAGVGGWGAVVC